MANRVSVFCCSKKYYPFIMKVNSGSDSQITIPTSGGGYNYDLRVQGGQVWYGLTGNHTINFPSANTDYFIEISGEFPTIRISDNSEEDKFLDIVQCGDIEWKDLQNSFRGASNLTWSATDIPNTRLVSNWEYAFQRTKINTNFNLLDKSSTVVNIRMLEDCGSFDNDGEVFKLDFQDVYNPTLSVIAGTKVKAIEFYNCQDGFIFEVIESEGAFSNCYDLVSAKLFGYRNSIKLTQNGIFHNIFLGSQLDDLFDSLGTAYSGATITISIAQNTSGIDTTIATSKGWTIIVV